MEIFLNPIGEEDQEVFCEMTEAFVDELWQYLPWPYGPAVIFWEELKKEKYVGYMIRNEIGEDLGFVLCEGRGSFLGQELYIHELYVADDCRRQGVASRAMELLTQTGMDISLDIIRDNQEAMAFWSYIMPRLNYEECKDNVFVQSSEEDPITGFYLWTKRKG